jgi:L-lactate dehydrogenase complex protein LldG
MTSSRDKILNRLRNARPPFPDAPPRPQQYVPVVTVEESTPDALLERFSAELTRISGEVYVVEGDEAARDKVLELLKGHKATHILAWHFNRIPVKKLRDAIEAAGIKVTQPDIRDEFRAETLESIRYAEVGLTGVDAAIAATGTLVVSTAPGKGRTPTVLPPAHIAVVRLEQIVPRLEDWLANARANGFTITQDSANLCFITGPSRTGDIEMELILGVHGPAKVQVVVKR